MAGKSLAKVMPEYVKDRDPREFALFKTLVYGSLREWPRLQGLLKQLMAKPLKEKDRDIAALLALGIHQLSELRIPPHAAVSETVSATQALGKGWAKGLVNGVLRNYQRRAEALERALTPAEKLALPDWLLDRFTKDWPDHIEPLAAAARSRPPMSLRINQNHTDRDAYLRALQQSGIAASLCLHSPVGIQLEEPTDVWALPDFKAGVCSVQDETAQLAASVIAPRPGDAVLDACAAPGGKACHLKEVAPLADITALDISEDRLERIRENTERLSLDIKIQCGDATQIAALNPHQRFDIILADVPCSATGVLRRNPDIKLLRRATDAVQFQTQQRAIVTSLWPLLRPGGRFYYVTCSVLKEENDDVVAFALEQLPHCEPLALKVPGAVMTKYGYQVLPQTHAGDGLFFAGLVRTD